MSKFVPYDVTILMPCLNEAETLGICIKRAMSWSARQPDIMVEVLVADNGSDDGSQAIATNHGARVINVLEHGYGAALYEGCRQAAGKYVIMADADDSYNFEEIDALFQSLDAGTDLVVGNRFLGVIAAGAMPWKNKYIGNPILSFIGRCLFPVRVRDFHCGLRGITKSAFLRLDLRTTGMEFASEMLIKAGILNLKIAEVPINLYPDGRSRSPHLRPWRDGWRHLRFMLLLSPRWLFIYPGLFFTILFSLFYLTLLSGPVVLNEVTFDINTLAYAQAGLVLSLLLIFMGSVLRAFAFREQLLPSRNWLEWIRKYPVLEVGVLLSILMVSVGVAWAIDTVSYWSQLGFGSINGPMIVRKVSLSSTMIMIGGLAFIWSLVMGFIALPLRKNRT